MRFVYLYKALAHPELNGYVNPVTLEERLMHVEEAKRTLGSEIPWIADTMTNDLKHAIGDRPNSEYLLDPEGRGKLYLAFLPDPLHGIHWNNRAPAMDVELTPPQGIEISPRKMKGPDVKEDADADPREFLVDVKLDAASEPLGLKFRYFACTDEWCRPITQEYLITWKVNRDAGRVVSRRGRGAWMQRDADGDGKLSMDEVPPRLQERFERLDTDGDGLLDEQELAAIRGRIGGRGGGDRVARMMRADTDGDGKISREEAPPQFNRRFDAMDTDETAF